MRRPHFLRDILEEAAAGFGLLVVFVLCFLVLHLA